MAGKWPGSEAASVAASVASSPFLAQRGRKTLGGPHSKNKNKNKKKSPLTGVQDGASPELRWEATCFPEVRGWYPALDLAKLFITGQAARPCGLGRCRCSGHGVFAILPGRQPPVPGERASAQGGLTGRGMCGCRVQGQGCLARRDRCFAGRRGKPSSASGRARPGPSLVNKGDPHSIRRHRGAT